MLSLTLGRGPHRLHRQDRMNGLYWILEIFFCRSDPHTPLRQPCFAACARSSACQNRRRRGRSQELGDIC